MKLPECCKKGGNAIDFAVVKGEGGADSLMEMKGRRKGEGGGGSMGAGVGGGWESLVRVVRCYLNWH